VGALRASLPALEAVLSRDEIERARRFQVASPRDQFVAGRGILRHLLAAYLGRDARALRFDYGPYGKPSLVDACGIDFSVSHSEDVLLIAVSNGYAIGVDVEHIREDVDHEDIAARYFAAEERTRLQSLPQGDRLRAFFCYWSRKEAVLKAVGAGLTNDLDAVEVAAASLGRSVPVRRRTGATDEAWFAYDLPVASGYSAALAARSAALRPIVLAIETTT
jgi:4'-phosphopantetheinyl transferase